MSPITHYLVSWLAADSFCTRRRERVIVSVSGIVPDVDGLVVIADMVAGDEHFAIYNEYHHILSHNLLFCCMFCFMAYILSRKSFRTVLLCFAVFHLHLACDIIGSRGPDGYQWPVPYLLPFSTQPMIQVSWQWELTAWQNMVISVAAIIFVFIRVRQYGNSPLEIFPEKLNQGFIHAVRNWGKKR